jgi:2-haloacid dehalogenase
LFRYTDFRAAFTRTFHEGRGGIASWCSTPRVDTLQGPPEDSEMTSTLAFDVYGTLIDTHGVVEALRPLVGEQARAFSMAWRDKQLEYSFRRGLMRNYETFAVCTRQALAHTCLKFQAPLTPEQTGDLLARYRSLPAFADAVEGLTRARAAGFRLFAFSNGCAEAVEDLLRQAGIRDFFLEVVSVDDLKSFKPDPGVYAHFLRRAGVAGGPAWMISGNPFDVIGALSAGMRAAWVQRSPQDLFDPWGIEPTLVVPSLTDLAQGIIAFNR